MERVIDFMRMIVYVILAVVIYFGVNQLLVVAEPWEGHGLLEMWQKDLARAHSVDSVEEVELIDQYLFINESPMVGQGKNFVRYGDEYDIPPRLMVAMSGAESNFGKNGYAIGTYNAVGLGVHEGRSYNNWEEGIKDMAWVLRNYYFDEGRDEPIEIQNKWAPRCVDGNACHNSWANNVQYFLSEMEDFSYEA